MRPLLSKQRGEVAIEFVIVFSIALITIGTISFIIIGPGGVSAETRKNFDEIRTRLAANRVADMVNTLAVITYGSTFSLNFDDMLGYGYSLTADTTGEYPLYVKVIDEATKTPLTPTAARVIIWPSAKSKPESSPLKAGINIDADSATASYRGVLLPIQFTTTDRLKYAYPWWNTYAIGA